MVAELSKGEECSFRLYSTLVGVPSLVSIEAHCPHRGRRLEQERPARRLAHENAEALKLPPWD
jgi:hypothetical protein